MGFNTVLVLDELEVPPLQETWRIYQEYVVNEKKTEDRDVLYPNGIVSLVESNLPTPIYLAVAGSMLNYFGGV